MFGADGVTRRGVMAGAMLISAPVRAAVNPIIATAAGTFIGATTGGIHSFKGIRYGRAARFQPPVVEKRTNERMSATDFGPVAPQGIARYQPQSEDCLFLNIWTPEIRASARKPVMVYIHGGAYSNGSSTDPLNDGAALAGRNVVVVTVNHRLNALGYLYLERFDPRFPDSGNAGQLDLVLALQWIRAHIAAFGGDPGNVTVFGQSGGGAKIATLTGMPAARGLFHRAITMSGQQVTASGPLNATARARAFLARLGRDPVTAPVESMVEALAATDPILGGSVYFGPVLDMRSLLRHPFWPDANPQSNAIPMLLGNTRDEARAFLPPDSPKVQALNWDNLAAIMAPELRVDIHPEWVVAQYRNRYPKWMPREVLWDAVTAGRSWRGQVEEAQVRATAEAPTWVYQLDFSDPARLEMGAPHTMDIALAFGTFAHPSSPTGIGPGAALMSAVMMAAFVGFAQQGTCDWPQYRTDWRTTMIFDTQSRVENDPRQWQRELFARVPYVQPGT